MWCGARKGRVPRIASFPVQEAGDGEDLCRFDRLGKRQVGEDRHEALGEHGLSGAGGADHQEVVPPGGGDLQGALGLLLAADLVEIDGVVETPPEELARIDPHRCDRGSAAEELHDLGEMIHRYDLDLGDERRLGGILPREDHPPDAQGTCPEGRGKGAVDPLHAAVQREFAQDEVVGEGPGGEELLGGQDRDGDRQVEGGALLFDIGGGQIDGDMMAGEGVAGVLDGGLDPVLALPDGHVGEADGRKQGKAGGEIDLYRDGMGIDADDGGTDCLDDQWNTPCGHGKSPYAAWHFPSSLRRTLKARLIPPGSCALPLELLPKPLLMLRLRGCF